MVEIVSPGNRAEELRNKVADYLKIGCKMVWLVYPNGYFVDVYRPDQPTLSFKRGDTVDGSDVLPGFHLKTDELFDPLIALDESTKKR